MDCIVSDTDVFGNDNLNSMPSTVTQPTRHPDYYFEDGTLVIQVSNRLVRSEDDTSIKFPCLTGRECVVQRHTVNIHAAFAGVQGYILLTANLECFGRGRGVVGPSSRVFIRYLQGGL
jgi:hypothetical protein